MKMTLSPTKRAIFAVLPTVVLLCAATIAFRLLERYGVIYTYRIDDQAQYSLGTVEIVPCGMGDCFETLNPGMLKSRFPAKKPRNTFRVFITGGSFMRGDPYIPGRGSDELPPGGIARWMKAYFEMRFPSLKFEVINAASGGANSKLVAHIVNDLVELDPDLIVVGSGNNEGWLPATPFNEALHRWIFYRVLKKTLLPEPDPSERSFFAPQDKDTKAIERGFRQNLRGIGEITSRRRVPLVLCTLPINLKYEGTESSDLHGEPFAKDDPNLEKGDRLFSHNRFEEAITAYAGSINQGCAALKIAKCYETTGRYDLAKKFYKIHVQQIPFNRTRPSYNEFVRRLAAQRGVLLVDLERLLESISPYGIPDTALFKDYCHMHWEGYRMAAEEIVSKIVDAGIVPARPLPAPATDEMIRKYHWEILKSDIKSGDDIR